MTSGEPRVVRIEKEVDANLTENTQDVRLKMVSHKKGRHMIFLVELICCILFVFRSRPVDSSSLYQKEEVEDTCLSQRKF